ncbi:unnamed protein product [Eruca vesicaria subsp. sativa]|uniref:Vps16 C-terminal domain-containing protein n=1 Tax=Eruca vesicaria subsp. sativa TaxID=29727 RepID=A0ABC8MA65_ERUVS|nr:unnamed protein product [Eruca vesicaria subsp. sativa]
MRKLWTSFQQRDHVQETCRTLRVLNAVRDPDIGIPLSIQQYKLLMTPVVLSRLINAHSHLLAMLISEYLGMNKLQLCRGISYAAVATHADNCGRRKLAATLVEHEPRSTKQVFSHVLWSLSDTALVKATESGDTDLVFLVIFHIWQKRPPLEFFAMIQGRVLAPFLLWKESWDMGKTPMASKGSPLQGPRIKLIEKANNLFSQTKEHTFESKAAEEHAKLLRQWKPDRYNMS